MTKQMLWVRKRRGRHGGGLPGFWVPDQAGVPTRQEVLMGLFAPEVSKQCKITKERATLGLNAQPPTAPNPPPRVGVEQAGLAGVTRELQSLEQFAF